MKILYLHGWQSAPGGVKPRFLVQQGHTVIEPALPPDDFPGAVALAEAAYREQQPDLVVGSSRGGAIAMNMASGATPLVLLAPAWKRWGMARTVKAGTLILHSQQDATIAYPDSLELIANSNLPPSALTTVGEEHTLADPVSLQALLAAVMSVTGRK